MGKYEILQRIEEMKRETELKRMPRSWPAICATTCKSMQKARR